MSVCQSAGQSVYQSQSVNHLLISSACRWVSLGVSQLDLPPVRQPVWQSVIQSVNYTIYQSVNQSRLASQSISKPINQSVGRFVSQSFLLFFHPSISQSTCTRLFLFPTVRLSVSQSVSRLVSQSVSLFFHPSVNHSVHPFLCPSVSKLVNY